MEQTNENSKEGQDQESEDEEDLDLPIIKPTKQQALAALELLRYYYQCEDSDKTSQLDKINTLQTDLNAVLKEKQSKITEFF